MVAIFSEALGPLRSIGIFFFILFIIIFFCLLSKSSCSVSFLCFGTCGRQPLPCLGLLAAKTKKTAKKRPFFKFQRIRVGKTEKEREKEIEIKLGANKNTCR